MLDYEEWNFSQRSVNSGTNSKKEIYIEKSKLQKQIEDNRNKINQLIEASKQLSTNLSNILSTSEIYNDDSIMDTIENTMQLAYKLDYKTRELMDMLYIDYMGILQVHNLLPLYDIKREEDITIIKCDRRFPHKMSLRCKNEGQKTIYEDYYIALYRQLQKSITNNEVWTYNEPVVVEFITHYKENEVLSDHDNLESSGFLDVITSMLLVEDNPYWCDLYYKAVFNDSKSFSEIRIIPKSGFRNLM